jgi:glycosyltransferase involved in cell wall biosynthesis
MRVSVVICGYTSDRFEVLTVAIDSMLVQTHPPDEIIIVIDGNTHLYERVVDLYAGHDKIIPELNAQNRGISYSRTRGARIATGDIVAFIDDDAVADPEWIAEHVAVFRAHDVIGVAGAVLPNWVEQRPEFFPAPFYWLVGCTEPGFAEDGEQVRNGYGSNVSYRRDAFLAVGGYDAATGRKGDRHIQAHEAPIGIKLANRYEQPLVYASAARVQHTLFSYRGRFSWLLFRAFWQGYSKFLLQRLYPGAQMEERLFAFRLLRREIPARVMSIPSKSAYQNVAQIIAMVAFSGAVALGYLWALLNHIVGRFDPRQT